MIEDADRAAKRGARTTWEADRAWLVFHQPLMATLAMHLDLVPVVDDRLPTASTDGRRVYVSPAFLATLSADERVFVLAHEVWHCALGHFLRQGDRDGDLWNVAIDHEVNALLVSEGLSMPGCGVIYPELVGQNAEQVYDQLEQHGGAVARGPGADVHPREEQDARPAVGKFDPDYLPGRSAEDLQAWPEHVLAAVQQAEPGTIPGAVQRLVDAIRRPTLRWSEVLRQFVTRVYGGRREWLPPSRRHLHRGLYLPSRREEQVSLVVALDTSGSTTEHIPAFLAELEAIARAFGRTTVTLIQCDCEVQSVKTYGPEEPLVAPDLAVAGGGGTSFVPVFEHVARGERPDALVYLTDGFGEAPDEAPPYPVLWVLTSNHALPAQWGSVAQLGSHP